MRIFIVGFLVFAAGMSSMAATDGPGIDGIDNKGLGVSSWAGWSPGQISPADNPHLRTVPLILQWNDLEPNQNDCRFEEVVGSRLIEAANDGLYVMITIWVRPSTPMWLFDELGVPRLRISGDSIHFIHAWRSGATYTLETCDNLISNSWTNAVYTLIGYEPYIEDMGFVTNRLDEPLSDAKFIRLRIGY